MHRRSFPASNAITFELGAVFDKQKKFTDAEAAFQQVLTRDPENAAALNYLGYMLADRGERLDESVGYLKKALEIEPDNGSYLDSIGWAYFKQNKLDLAEANLRRAAEQLKTNSVIQSHFGEVLFKAGRYDRGHRGVEPRVDRRRRRDRSRRPRQEDPHREAKNQEMNAGAGPRGGRRDRRVRSSAAEAADWGRALPMERLARVHALAQATDACRAIRTLTAEVAVSGSAGGHRLRGRLSVGVAAPASVRLEAVAPFGAPLFFFVATDNDATLLLSQDDRVLEHGQPAAGSPGGRRRAARRCGSRSGADRMRSDGAGDRWPRSSATSGWP